MNPTPHVRVFPLPALALLLAGPAFATSFTVNYDPTSAGSAGYSVTNWTYDVKNKGPNDTQINADIDNAGGSGAFDSVRVAWYPQYALVNSGTALSSSATSEMDDEVRRANLRLSGKVLFLSPKTGGIDPWYVNSDGTINVSRWVKAMELSRDYYKNTYGKTIQYNGPCNEPDNTGGKFNATIFVNIRNAMSGWGTTTNVGPCSFDAGTGATWLPTIETKIGHASTHCIGNSTLDDYRSFDNTAGSYGLTTWNSESHNMAETLVAAERQFTRVCWWSTIGDQNGNGRGMLMQVQNNNRIFYYTDFNTDASGKWTTTAAYRDNVANSVWIFWGNKTAAGVTLVYHSSIPVTYSGGGGRIVSTTATDCTISAAADGSAGAEGALHVTW